MLGISPSSHNPKERLIMKKLFAVVFFTVLSAVAMFPFSASAQTPPSVPTARVIPNFSGQWVLGLPGGRMVDENGTRQDFQYTELIVNMTGGSGGSDGSMSFGGDIVSRAGSFFNIYYNPATPKHFEMYMYMPEPSIGSSGQYFLQVNVRLFVSPDGNFLYGTMAAAFYDNLTGRSVPTVLYHSDAFFSRYGARG
jgi:hypothetical protein